MKRSRETLRRLCGLAAVVALSGIVSAPSSAQSTIAVVVNGEQVQFVQPPIEQADRVFVPLRGVFERLGASVEYSAATILANRGDTTVALRIGSNVGYVNGYEVQLDVTPFIIGSRTLVPLRFISESLGAAVDWNQAQQTVYVDLTAPMAPPPQGWPPPLSASLAASQRLVARVWPPAA